MNVMNLHQQRLKLYITQSVIGLFVLMAIIGTVFCTDAFAEASPGDHEETIELDMSSTKAGVMKFALIAAAVAFGLGALGAGFAISHVGAAAMGAVAEKPEVGKNALLYIALAEGIVVFGFLTALMILGEV
ncbi:MAG: ATP synthase subunit C [Planctomycetota bacterium]|jgi:V/A-type H+-transporting ATPase subunit K